MYVFSRMKVMQVIAEALEGKENEDSHEDTGRLLQDMSEINTEASHSDN